MTFSVKAHSGVLIWRKKFNVERARMTNLQGKCLYICTEEKEDIHTRIQRRSSPHDLPSGWMLIQPYRGGGGGGESTSVECLFLMTPLPQQPKYNPFAHFNTSRCPPSQEGH